MKNPNELTQIEIIQGVGGLCITINDYRICGNKAYGGGTVLKTWKIPTSLITDHLGKLNENKKRIRK